MGLIDNFQSLNFKINPVSSKTGATSNMNKKSELFLPTNIFEVKTLEKIGNGNFGIVFKVKISRKMATLGKVQHTYSKVVAVKKSTQIWDIHDEECDAMKNIVEFLEGQGLCDFLLNLNYLTFIKLTIIKILVLKHLV